MFVREAKLAYLLLVFFVTKYVVSDKLYINSSGDDYPVEEFDFIVVGAGSAGAVVASRLSENKNWNVAIFEAGGKQAVTSYIPYIAFIQQRTSVDWKYVLEPQNKACLSMENNQCTYARGKCLGGTSSINYLIYTRGHHRDYDEWEALGNPGWAYKSVLPYFLKSEGNLNKDGEYHNQNGELTVEDIPYYTPIAGPYVDSAKYLGYNNVDLNSKSEAGFFRIQATSRNGTRVSASKAFLEPVSSRKNLHIYIKSHVLNVLINPKSKRAYGVLVMRNGKHIIAKARKEVILSAGTTNSPQLLMLSGIGPRKHLEDKGIPVIQDLPGVGKNVQDRVTSPVVIFTVDKPILSPGLHVLSNPLNYKNYVFKREGPFTSTGAEGLGIAYTKFAKPNVDRPDVEMFLMSANIASDAGLFIVDLCNVKREVYKSYYKPLLLKHAYYIFPVLLRPRSRGHIKLRDSDPLSPPLLYANFLDDPHDAAVIVEGFKLAAKLGGAPPLRKFGARMYEKHYPGCENFEVGSDEYWECCIRHFTFHLWHFCGSCKMGNSSDRMAVVNHELKVYGVQGLRIADASIMPKIPGAHLHAATTMIGEKAADMIKHEHLQDF